MLKAKCTMHSCTKLSTVKYIVPIGDSFTNRNVCTACQYTGQTKGTLGTREYKTGYTYVFVENVIMIYRYNKHTVKLQMYWDITGFE